METKVLTVNNAKAYYTSAPASPKRCPAIRLEGDWLHEIGFTYGRSAIAEYGQGRIILRLQDPGHYQELVKEALKTNSGLFHVQRGQNNNVAFPRLDVREFRLQQFGFTAGSVVIAHFQYGLITLLLVDFDQLETDRSKADMSIKRLVVTRSKVSHSKHRRPMITLQGEWLAQIGFTPGKLVAAEYTAGQMIFRLQDSDHSQTSETGNLKPSQGLFKVWRSVVRETEFPRIHIKGLWLANLGFKIGQSFTVRYDYGLIKLSVEEEP
ncbi:MAG: hypothetical protein K6U80_18855 [Firmicutes bacterium]|nr:hypothetical protein [Bacillota bacterium]